MTRHPDFILVGAPKCGTTSLYRALAEHPNIGLPLSKEPNFFNKDKNYEKGWKWYLNLFKGLENKTVIGEGSVTYSLSGMYPKTAPRISQHLPDARLIYMVRDPIKQVTSHWLETQKYALGDANFSSDIRNENLYIDACRYWKQINVFRNFFPDEKILVIFFEDFIVDQARTLEKCYKFLGVENVNVSQKITHKKENVSKGGTKPTSIGYIFDKIGIGQILRDNLPAQVRKLGVKFVRKPLPQRPHLSGELLNWFSGEIRNDSEKFLNKYGKDHNYWGICQAATSNKINQKSLFKI